jgi:tetracycline 7-halogenase / FADH2 O2-dependent halogenase
MMAPVTRVDADVAIVGSGFAGSLTALCLLRRGKRVVMVERGRHPRFAIGESSTPLANLLIEELADRYDLPRIKPFSKWGTWQRTRPDVPCGLKRGFSFFFHRLNEAFDHDGNGAGDGGRARQLLVAASPHDEIADTHWYRPTFDEMLAREAEAAGAIHLDETRLEHVRHEGALTILEGTRRNGASVRIAAPFVIDASGPRGFLHHALGFEEAPLRWLPPTSGLFTHFEGVERWDRLHPAARWASSSASSCGASSSAATATTASAALASAAGCAPPYPVDDAALHQVFPGGWIWILRFNNGITSAGVAHMHGARADALRLNEGAPAWERLLESLPSVREQFRAARAVHPFVYAPRVAFRSHQVCGDTWALLPSAAGVIDPLLSTGFPLTLLGIARLVDLLEHTAPGTAERQTALRDYARVTQDELDITEQLVGALYANMSDPPVFKRLALLYFAAASFSEAARRLGRPELAPGFLLHRHPRFGPELRACAAEAIEVAAMASSDAATPAAASAPCAAASGALREALLARIDIAIEPFDIAGLRDRTRRDWYPALADDLIAGAAKLDASAEDIDRLLTRSGFTVARAG